MPTDPGFGKALRDGWHPVREADRHERNAPGHRHFGTIPNANEVETEHLTTGQRIADAVASNMGSWRFIVVQSCLLVCWVVFNVAAWIQHWDPYPFILLNLALSFQAAYSAPIIMMSQNRQAAKDRLSAELDYHVNVRAEHEITAINRRLDELSQQQWAPLLEMQRHQMDLLRRLDALTAKLEQAATPGRDVPPGSSG